MSINAEDAETQPLMSPGDVGDINGDCYNATHINRNAPSNDKATEGAAAADNETTETSQNNSNSPDSEVTLPKYKWILEPSVLLFCLGFMGLNAVLPQYLYFRVSLHYNATANLTRAFVCNASDAANSSDSQLTQQIQAEASSWSLYRSLASSIAALLVAPILASSSDFLGRKFPIILPSIGALLDAVICLCVLLFHLPIPLLVAASFINGITGGFGVFLAGAFAYLADTTTRSSRAVRIAIVEGTFAVGVFVTELCMGWWMRLEGYSAPLMFTSGVVLVNALYVLLVLPEVRPAQRSKLMAAADAGVCQLLLKPFTNIASLFRISSSITSSLLLLLLALLLYCIAFMGSNTVGSLYQMNLPFCFDSVAIGYLSAAKIVSAQVGTFLGLGLLRHWLGDHGLSLLGLVSAAGSYALTAFAKTRIELYTAAAAAALAFLPIPLFRAHMSRLLPGDRQGALFSCIAVLEVGGNLIGAAAFVSMYTATLAVLPGAVYLLCVVLAAGSFVLTACSACVERRGAGGGGDVASKEDF